MNILLAEDERNFGLVLKRELEEEHYEVDLVPNGVEAVLRFIRHPYDFVLLDLRMPRLSGIDALKIIKTIHPEVPAITFSGGAESNEKEASLRFGAIRCLTKPFEIAELKMNIKASISR